MSVTRTANWRKVLLCATRSRDLSLAKFDLVSLCSETPRRKKARMGHKAMVQPCLAMSRASTGKAGVRWVI